jgi:hypothetical protein
MLPNLETDAAAAKMDRQLTLRRAERRALHLATAPRPPMPPERATVRAPAPHREYLSRVVRSLRALVRLLPA